MPSGHHEPEVAATGKPPATEDLLTTLPEGVAVPEGMVFVPGGITAVGAEDGLAREQPVIARQIRGFFMDITPVTVAQFREFVQATGYVTQAEKYGDAAVFNMETGEWYLHKGAYWEFPRGPENGPAPPDHPVTQVSYNDALAYCKWAGKRLPTEAEWEHAARNGSNSRSKYSWGEEIFQNGVFKANFWQGHFPLENTLEDGFEFTSPVGAFGETPLGLKDMSGNVWEWCSDWYLPYGNDPSHFIPKPESEKVMRGGSFMCDPSYCWGYRVSGRSGTTPETGLFHVGFRCVKDVE
ncbi:MAG: formylglycine-generating enzyme family protein [Bacteroidetes bacterium]|nr:MAG: formylglycine-generating enzyme family protein [Bacteroidota bacterium]